MQRSSPGVDRLTGISVETPEMWLSCSTLSVCTTYRRSPFLSLRGLLPQVGTVRTTHVLLHRRRKLPDPVYCHVHHSSLPKPGGRERGERWCRRFGFQPIGYGYSFFFFFSGIFSAEAHAARCWIGNTQQ